MTSQHEAHIMIIIMIIITQKLQHFMIIIIHNTHNNRQSGNKTQPPQRQKNATEANTNHSNIRLKVEAVSFQDPEVCESGHGVVRLRLEWLELAGNLVDRQACFVYGDFSVGQKRI